MMYEGEARRALGGQMVGTGERRARPLPPPNRRGCDRVRDRGAAGGNVYE